MDKQPEANHSKKATILLRDVAFLYRCVRISGLFTDAEFFDDGTITFDIDLHQVVEQTTTLTYEHLQCARSIEVFLVLLHVLGQMTDAIRE